MYTESLVAFLDILGFTDAVYSAHGDNEAIKSLVDVLKEIQSLRDQINENAEKSGVDFRVHTFSDSIVLRCAGYSDESFVRMAHLIALFEFIVIKHKFVLSGALSAGEYYDENEIYFGPAYIDAYLWEKRNLWPRVVLHPAALRVLDLDAIDRAVGSYLVRDGTGLYFFSYLHLIFVASIFPLLEKHTKKEFDSIELFKRFREHKEALLSMIEKIKEKGQIDLLPRYHGVALYHNRYMNELLKGLPTTDNYEKIVPGSTIHQIMEAYKHMASSQQDVGDYDIEQFLRESTKLLYKDRKLLESLKINLPSVFQPLYSIRARE